MIISFKFMNYITDHLTSVFCFEMYFDTTFLLNCNASVSVFLVFAWSCFVFVFFFVLWGFVCIIVVYIYIYLYKLCICTGITFSAYYCCFVFSKDSE